MTQKPKTTNASESKQTQNENGKKSPTAVGGGDGQSSSATSDDITNQENRPNNQLNGSGERTKKTSRKKWVPLPIDVRTSRGGGRKERTSGGASNRAGGSGRTRNRDSISKDAPAAPASTEGSWRGDSERRAVAFGKAPRGTRPPTTAAGANAAAPVTANGGPAFRRAHPSRRGGAGAPGPGGFKKGEGRMVNGKLEGVAPLPDQKNGVPLYYGYRQDPTAYLKDCIRHQM